MELKKLQVKLISLVDKGANKKTIIYKDQHLKEIYRVNFTKSDEEGIVYGIVYAPDEIDSQGDFANANEIKKAAYEFMKNGNAYRVDVNHNLKPANAYICESWIVKSKDEFFSEVGAWAVGIKIDDENIKKSIKEGEITGLSMFGEAVRKSKTISDVISDTLEKFFNSSVNKNKGENMPNEKTQENTELQNFKAELTAIKTELEKLKNELKDILDRSNQTNDTNKDENVSFSKGVL